MADSNNGSGESNHNGGTRVNKMLTRNPENNLLIKVQAATKDWDTAPQELIELHSLLTKSGYEVNWSPKKLGVNMLTPNKIRGMVLKRALMKLYPFEGFWLTETLDETLHKCLLVCQQLSLEADHRLVWGQCSMDASYEFWKRVLEKTVIVMGKSGNEEQCIQEAKSNIVSALIASRGTDWDKRIAQNFGEGIGSNRYSVFAKLNKSLIPSQSRQKILGHRSARHASIHSFPIVYRKSRFEGNNEWVKTTSTTSFAGDLKKEALEMDEILKSIEKLYRNDCVLQIDSTLLLSKRVAELAADFEGYMTANNRGAFKDVESLTNHTDKVIRSMSKLTASYSELFLEFQKYLRSAGSGDELSVSTKLAEMN